MHLTSEVPIYIHHLAESLSPSVWTHINSIEVDFTIKAVKGFGSKMVQMSMGGQLSGSIKYDWQPTGLVATLEMRAAALAR